ncbi:MAG: ACT domain-containing protein [Candidatus Anammoximicrobium sp.]|nr:ACT domain-containing protein [Candidatus Anammoximicrobium sp.]
MKIHQLSVFVENRPGHLVAPCRLLAQAGINIVTLALAETQQYGILRLIVRDWQKAKDVLQASGFRVTITEVLAVQVDDRPGGLAEVLEPISAAELNVEYMYAFSMKANEQAVLVFRFEDPDLALRTLQGSAVNFIDTVELFGRLGPV